MSNLHIVDVEYHTELKGGAHRVKVSLLDLGMYINGFRVFPPNDEHDDWWVFAPQRYVPGRKAINIVEFNKSEPLWKEIFDRCVECVQEYKRFGKLDKQIVLDKEKSKPELESLFDSYDQNLSSEQDGDDYEYLSRE